MDFRMCVDGCIGDIPPGNLSAALSKGALKVICPFSDQ
jgi:hypothetical protein